MNRGSANRRRRHRRLCGFAYVFQRRPRVYVPLRANSNVFLSPRARGAVNTGPFTRRRLRLSVRARTMFGHLPGLCLRAPRRSRQKWILIAGTVHCWLVGRPRAAGGPACHRLIDKGLSVLGAAGPKRWRTIAILTRPSTRPEEFGRGNAVKARFIESPLWVTLY